jgi:hypothetical protein
MQTTLTLSHGTLSTAGVLLLSITLQPFCDSH